MIKITDLNITLNSLEQSKTWDYGTYKLLSSDINNYGARKADGTIDLTIAQRILDANVNKALMQIKRDLDKKSILSIFEWSDLAHTRFVEGLVKVIEGQLSGMITDGNKEIKQGASYEGSGVSTAADISGFLTSGDRIYKYTEDTWYNYKLDQYDVEYDESTKTFSLIDLSEGTVKLIQAQIILSDAQLLTIANDLKTNIKNDQAFLALIKGDPGSNAPAMFDVVDDGGKEVLQPKDGRDVQLVDDSGNGITPTSPHSAISKDYVDNQLLSKADLSELEANNWEKIINITKRIFTAGGGNPADPTLPDGLVAWGDLEDQTIRTDFMNNAKVGDWYTVLIGAKAALVVVRSGDKTTNFKLSGLSVNSGPTGDTFEAIEANVMSIAVSYWAGSFTGVFNVPYLQLPNSYNQMELMPKAAIEQMIIDAAGSNEYANAQILSENQFYSHKTDTERTWIHGEKIATPSNQAGWVIKDNWTMDFYDDLKNVIGITYTPGLVQEAQFVFPEGIVNCKVEIKKITTWDNSWDGTGAPAGTNNGWEIKFHTPVDEQGNATTFHRDTSPLRMKLVSVNNNERIVDIPSDIFENFDNMVNKPVVNEEQWMQYNVVDSLGNRFLNYGPTAPTKKQVIVLPANRTIYDIQSVECYSNNRQRWYDEYKDTPLIQKFSKMTNRLYLALKADNIESMMKVNIKLGRTDDKGNYTEFNAWEFRPVIENGVINPNKVEITNKGVFYGTYNGNLNPLPAGQADIHYMVIKYKGVI